ncbi:MAG: cob(I)yrinic acid a,c-diamide adenosyltransferase [Propionibacteriaceae bacterium]|jgi:ATP:cob(I)alamin adenosyltransferase|nr:cob(I)yrinic acid a,c-diamide adenosyltransferase [Propionibacteriaceae bacterium]
MGNVYTRSGDKGLTGLLGGTRLPKDDVRVEAYGTIDEANSAIGAAKVWLDEPRETLHHIQTRLFALASEVASDEKGLATLKDTVSQADIDALERLIDRCLEFTGPQHRFVIPGTDFGSAALHQARTITRRAERRVITLAGIAAVRPEVIKYLNRLSDALFALARVEEVKQERRKLELLVRREVGKLFAPEPTAVVLDLPTAKRLAEHAEHQADQMGVPIVFAAVDAAGNLILTERQPGSLLASIRIAQGKAYTAAALKAPTDGLAQLAGPGGPLYGIEGTDERIVLFGGGLPVFAGETLLGGVGISGGTVEEDIEIIQYAFDKVYGS